MKKKALWRDIRRAISHSKGRFLSIVGLMALGSFALVGLYVTGPDMRATGEAYLDSLDAADLTVIGDFGLSDADCSLIEQASGIRNVEYGYLKDATIKGTDESVRVQSAPEEISRYQVVEGRMPRTSGEIALDSYLADEYDLGDRIDLEEKEDAQGDTVLANDDFTVVGFVDSSELISGVNLGESTAGSGALTGYAVVVPQAFDSDVYMTARLTFNDTEGLDPYSDAYADRVHAHRDELEDLLADRPGLRLAEVRADAQSAIDDGQAELDDGRARLDEARGTLASSRAQLDDAEGQIAESERELASRTADAQAVLDAGAEKVASGRAELAAGRTELDAKRAQLTDARAQIAAGEAELEQKQSELDEKQTSYDAAMAQRADLAGKLDQVNAGIADIDAQVPDLDGAIAQASSDVDAAQAALDGAFPGGRPDEGDADLDAYLALSDKLTAAQATLQQLRDLSERRAGLVANQVELTAGIAAIDQATDGAAEELAAARDQIEAARAQLGELTAQADEGERQLSAAEGQLAGSESLLEGSERELADGAAELAATRSAAQAQIDAAKQEVAAKEAEYASALAEYEEQLPGAQAELDDAEEELAQARERLDRLEEPGYDVDTRREIPGGDGYKIYATVADIVDALARVFPVLLYFIAALVTFTTMTRMVEEERIGAGTLKALGYSDGDIALKFTVYGLISSMVGTAIGIAAGHTLLPYIVYNAYATKFVLPPIELTFDPVISLVAVALGLVSAVLPAWVAAKQELTARPAELLLPKPPAAGSKILLERIPFIWNRLDFTHKVTARNLFRYKKRMLMTIFGVAGAVVLLVAGFGTQYSISGISDEQFGNIVTYDMIVAESPMATDAERADLEGALAGDGVRCSMPIRYEDVTRVAGASGDTQDITLLVPEDPSEIGEYLKLRDRTSGEEVPLDDDSCVLSERLAALLGVGAGDTFTVDDATGSPHELTCTGVTEMYMGHFIFLGSDAYRDAFGEDASPNAYLVTLRDSSADNVNETAASLMELPAVEGIVQNTALIAQIATIVESLNKIMVVLIVVATLLAGVILYNLTTINVSERIRELSTIKVLGFFDNEVTMYIYRETMVLTAIGIVVGWILGVLFRNYIITVVPPDNVMFDPAFAPYVFAIPLIIVVIIMVLLGFAVYRRLRDVNMLEALKSVE